MKIVVTAQGPDLDADVDPRFGRARFFLVVDTENEEFSAHDNMQNLIVQQGAGIQAGRRVADLGVEAVLTGNVGPKAFATLQAANVKIYPGAVGTVREAVRKFKAGEYQAVAGANVNGHWM